MGIAYKMFKVKKSQQGKIFPLYVLADKAVPLNIWLNAECGERTEKGKVKSKLGELAFRPGWHLSDYPIATHIGKKDEEGNIVAQKSDTVWAVCEYSDSINYQNEANKRGRTSKGRFDARKACLDYIPKNGYYRYKTNPMMMGDWIIAGEMKILKILTDKEVAEILIRNNISVMPREGGEIDLSKYGLIYT